MSADNAEVLYAVESHVATITLNRPERMNTISRVMLETVSRLLLKARDDADVRVVVLTGTGRAFCAGLDLRREEGSEKLGVLDADAPVRTTIDLRNAPPTVLHEMDKPTICVLNGSAAGYGFDMAMGCDIRLMSDKAKLSAAFTKRGIVPESGGTWLLPRMLGWAKAAELIFTGRTLSATESLDLGLVSALHSAEDLPDAASSLAAEMVNSAPLAVQAAKRMMRMGLNEPFTEHIHHVYLQLLPLMRTEDQKEGMAAFMEKREAVYKGH
jgi:enoyl-CoA hydratase/carnithine racemase